MTEKKEADLTDRAQTRERLRREKPAVYAKFLQLDEKLKKGEAPPPVIELAYRYDCNLSCKHCFASRFEKKDRKLSIQEVKALSRQATELGAYQFILQGGEPLYWKEFDEVVAAIDPKQFYLGLVTNATLLNKEKVAHLRRIGIDKIVISLDSFDMEQYEDNRSAPGLFKHTIDRILQAKAAGLRVVINTLATKQNVRGTQLLKLIEFAKQNDLIVYANFAAPIGSWEGRYDLLLDRDDADYVYGLNARHEVIKRDIYPFRGQKIGCPAFRSVVYITQYGDVLPCPFIHISVGNLFENSLAQILKKGMRLKIFKNPPQVCLACEHTDFIKNKIAKTYGKPSPANVDEIFSREEFD